MKKTKWSIVEIHIGIAFQLDGMAFSVCGFEPNSEISNLVYLWESKKISVNALIEEINNCVQQLKARFFSAENENYLHIYYVNKNNLVSAKLETVTNKKDSVDVYTKILEPLATIEEGVGLITSAINDRTLKITNNIDVDLIQREMDSIILEDEKTTPIVTALNHSLGEMLFRRISNQEDEITNALQYRFRNEAMSYVFSAGCFL